MAAKSFYSQLAGALEARQQAGLKRALTPVAGSKPTLTIDGQPLINLASNDYLGLSQHPRLKAAAKEAIDTDGNGAGASRLITGSLDRHHAIEQQFARFKHAGAALLLPTGYMANLAAITALAGPGDRICLDKLNHASLIDAAKMSGAEVRTFPHRGYGKLERLLGRADNDRAATPGRKTPQSPSPSDDGESRPQRTLILTDSVFSMDGDVADLPRLCDLAERHDACLIVDEAHATGVLGASGAGLCEAQGVVDRVDVVISTASKALGSLGGLVTAAPVVIETLINHARSAIYTTAVPPAMAGCLEAALSVLAAEPERRERLASLSQWVRGELAAMGWLADENGLTVNAKDDHTLPPAERTGTPIIPLQVGDPHRAMALSRHLRDHGILAAPIRYPTVAPGTDRVRLSLRADLTDRQIQTLLWAVRQFER
jgi:7-keto-8-aminopelargonate synthetase-like enzyme